MRPLPLLIVLAGCAGSPDPTDTSTDADADADADADSDADADTDTDTDASASALGACPSTPPSTTIWCDDFESADDPGNRYFEFGGDDGDFARVQLADGNHAMRVVWQPGEVGAGGMKVFFGDNPAHYDGGGPLVRPGETFDEVYWRMFVMHEQGWPDVGPAKLSRATVFSGSDWSQAMIAHLWSGANNALVGDPAQCVSGSTVRCSGYNDFDSLQWLGIMHGSNQLFSSAWSGEWHCVEGHVRLNTPGQSDGVFEFWIDDVLQNRQDGFDWRGSYTGHGLNAVMFENYWNEGAPAELHRWFDGLAIATERIGCE